VLVMCVSCAIFFALITLAVGRQVFNQEIICPVCMELFDRSHPTGFLHYGHQQPDFRSDYTFIFCVVLVWTPANGWKHGLTVRGRVTVRLREVNPTRHYPKNNA